MNCPAFGQTFYNCNSIEDIYQVRTKKKDKQIVKLNGVPLPMQIDMGSDLTLIPKIFWQEMVWPKLKRSYLKLRQFDGSCITTLVQFETTFEAKEKFEIIPLIVVDCFKNDGLISTDILKIETAKINNNVESEEQKVGVLKMIWSDNSIERRYFTLLLWIL